MAMALVLVGCNNDTKNVEVGEPLEVNEQIALECDTPFSINVIAPNENTNVTVGDDNHTSEFGLDVSYMVYWECPIPEETEREPVDGVCDEGWEFANDCATVCTPIEEVCLADSLCGEGTYLDENNTCQVDDRPDVGECGEGTELIEGVCTPIEV